MDRLAYPERLLLGYFLGRITRPVRARRPGGSAGPAAGGPPGGPGIFRGVVCGHWPTSPALMAKWWQAYLHHKHTPEAQLFGHCALFLAEFLAENEPAWRPRLAHLLALPVPPEVHAFPRGRRAFAEIVAAWHDAPDRVVPAALLARLHQEATTVPRTPGAPGAAAGVLQPVSGRLLLSGGRRAVPHRPVSRRCSTGWTSPTAISRAGLAGEPTCSTSCCGLSGRGRAAHRAHQRRGQLHLHSLFELETHSWLLDYFQVHIWLVELHFAAGTNAAEETAPAAATYSRVCRAAPHAVFRNGGRADTLKTE